jgi:putative esterase
MRNAERNERLSNGRGMTRVLQQRGRLSIVAVAVAVAAACCAAVAASQAPPAGGLRFEISIAPSLTEPAADGRLFVMLSRSGDREPRLAAGRTGMDAPPILARDVAGFGPGKTAVVDRTAVAFPIESLSALEPGEYFAQALFDTNIDLKSINSAGNLYSGVQKVTVDPSKEAVVRLALDQKLPPEQLPPDTDLIKFVRIESKLLSAFHKRPIYLRAGVLLPRDYDPAKRYPLRVRIGGYGARFTAVQNLLTGQSAFRAAWMADDAPRMILLHLDGDGPLGDPYQVNSDNHGPYGDAITQELIPYVEQKFHAVGTPASRVLDGGSTGGWVSLALQVFYPDFFNGTWSSCPDGVDFRAFQLVNIYEDANAYVNKFGFERPSMRELSGETRFTMRHECQMENVLGAGDNWAMSGEQWGAWNATYGPRGPDGRPVPLWDPKSGAIRRDVAEHWKKYDLRLVLEQNWATLGPKLRGKIHISVGEADNYFLNNAVHMLDAFLSKANPPYEGSIEYGPGKGHCWTALTPRQMMEAMAARTGM